jgi:predicted alpha/beta hydrolase family esterase
MKILFLHGLESKPGGPKPTFLANYGYDIVEPALPKDNWNASVKIARETFKQEHPDAVVGSSRGAAVAIAADLPTRKLVLIAPAWRKYCSSCTVPSTAVILHSPYDNIISFSDSELLAEESGANLIEVGVNHRMNDENTFQELIQAINKAN